MSRSSKSSAPPSQLTVIRLLLVLALCGAGYLAWGAFQRGPVAGCGEGSGCQRVLSTHWAYLFGVPVSVLAVLAYGALLALTFRLKRGWTPTLVLCGLVAGSALWFIGLQALVIHSFCKLCMGTHTAALAAVVLLVMQVPRAMPEATPSRRNKRPPKPAPVPGMSGAVVVRWLALGAAGAVVFAAGQWLAPTRTFAVKSGPAAARNARTLSLHQGAFVLNLDETPMLGARAATNVIVSLFDYTCPHCREEYALLAGALARFSNQLAVAALAMPLNSNCNPSIQFVQRRHQQACEYARLGLAVALADASAFPSFHAKMFERQDPWPLDQARQLAARFVGAEKLSAALTNDWITRQIVRNGSLYVSNSVQLRNGAMPQLIIGPAIVAGSVNAPVDLDRLLEQHLGLKPSLP